MTYIAIVGSFSFIVASVAVPVARIIGQRRNILDIPNVRSSHKNPIPRTGGVGILIGVVVGMWAGFTLCSGRLDIPVWVLMGALFLGALMGMIDDMFHMPTAIRLPLYLSVSAIVAVFAVRIEVFDIPGLPAIFMGPILGVVFSVLFIAWYTNLFNFMDGIDGIAGATASVTMGALAIAFFAHDKLPLGIIAIATASASVGFLLHNYHPASVFMGDVGSVFLGLTAGALSLAVVELGILSLSAAVFLMLPFVFDSTFTLIRRMINRERFWTAHRSHIYQQMCDLGLGHRSVTTIYTVCAVLFAVVGLYFDQLPGWTQVVVWWGSLAILLFLSLYILFKNSRKKITG